MKRYYFSQTTFPSRMVFVGGVDVPPDAQKSNPPPVEQTGVVDAKLQGDQAKGAAATMIERGAGKAEELATKKVDFAKEGYDSLKDMLIDKVNNEKHVPNIAQVSDIKKIQEKADFKKLEEAMKVIPKEEDDSGVTNMRPGDQLMDYYAARWDKDMGAPFKNVPGKDGVMDIDKLVKVIEDGGQPKYDALMAMLKKVDTYGAKIKTILA